MKITQICRALSGKYAEKFVKYGTYAPTPLSLAKLTTFVSGDLSALRSAKFLSKELPVRLANIMQEIHLLPDNLLNTPSVSLVISWYENSFKELIDFEQGRIDESNVNTFTNAMDKIRNRHADVVNTMAEGIIELRERHRVDIITNNHLQYFLDRFYMMRISIRMLINQHVLLFGSKEVSPQRFIGTIDPNCNIYEIILDAYDNAKYLCNHYYAGAPDLEFDMDVGFLKEYHMVYVPSHLYHILFELIKNSMRAVMESVQIKKTDTIPPVKIMVAVGSEDVTIKISDKGGGIPRSQMDFVFQYTYTTGQQKLLEGRSENSNAPLAGYGYGLPLSRLYAKYFNGELQLASLDGYGTEALIYLKKSEAEADEVLPIFNKTSAKQYNSSSVPVHDWSNLR